MIESAIDFRLLGPDDLDQMHALLTMFGEAFQEAEVYGGNRPGDAYFGRLLGGDAFLAMVAVKDGDVVGGLAAYVLPKFEQERSEIFVYDLAVAEAHRRQGIATGLLMELKKIAAARGAYLVFIQAERDDEPAVAVYSKLGTRLEALHFEIAVEQPDPNSA